MVCQELSEVSSDNTIVHCVQCIHETGQIHLELIVAELHKLGPKCIYRAGCSCSLRCFTLC